MVRAEDIEDIGLFDGLKEDELETIAALASRQKYQPDDIIITPENYTTYVYILEDSNDAVRMEVPGKDGEPNLVVHTLSKGETFAWTPLCRPYVRSTIARAIKPATVIIVNGMGLNKLMEENEHIGHIIMKNLAGILSKRLAYVTVVLAREVQKLREKEPVR